MARESEERDPKEKGVESDREEVANQHVIYYIKEEPFPRRFI